MKIFYCSWFNGNQTENLTQPNKYTSLLGSLDLKILLYLQVVFTKIESPDKMPIHIYFIPGKTQSEATRNGRRAASQSAPRIT